MEGVIARVEVTFAGESRGAVTAAKDTAQALQRVKKEAGEAGKALGHHSHALNDGTKELGRFTRGAAAGSGVLSHFGRSVAFASSAFLGAAGLTAVVKSSIDAGAELQTQTVRTSKVFGEQAGVIKAWSKDSAESLRLTRSAALDAASTFGTLLANMGVAPEKVAPMSKSLVQLAADMAAFKGVKPEVALTALEAAVAGRTRGLKQLGVTIDATMVKQEAEREGLVKARVDTGKVRDAELALTIAEQHLADAIKKHGDRSVEAAQATERLHKAQDAAKAAMAGHAEALTNAQKATATYNLILAQTTKQQGAVGRTSHTLAGETATLHAQIGDLQEELGTALIPVLTKYLPLLTGWISRNEKNGTFQRDFNKAVKIAGEVIDGVIPAVRTIAHLFKVFSDNVGGTKTAVEILGGVFVGAKFAGPVLRATKMIRDFRLALLGAEAAAGAGPGAAALGGGLRAALLALGDSAVIAALAAGTAALAPLVAGIYGLNKQTASTAGRQFAGHDVRVQGPKTFVVSISAHRSIQYDKGQWYNTEDGSKLSPQQAAKMLGISVAELNKQIGLQATANAGTPTAPSSGGGAGSEAAAKAAAGKGHGAPGATAVTGGTVSEIARSAAASPGAHATSFHLEGERTPYDCSAFVQAVFRKAGLGDVGSTTYTQFGHGRKIDKSDLQADDVVFFNYPGEKSPGHVGIYVGGGMMVHDHGASRGVDYQPVDWSAYVGARCFIPTHVHAAGTKGATDPATGGKFTEKPKPAPKPHVTTGIDLLSSATRIALAGADTPGERRSALVRAREELEKLQKTASKRERVPIAEELGRINKAIQSIDVAAHRAKMAAIARAQANTTARVKAAIAAQKTAWENHVRDLQQIADEAKSKFEDQWGKMASATLDAFDKATARGMTKLQKDFARQLDEFDAETARGLAGLAAPDETPEERALREFRAKRNQAQHDEHLGQLQKALTDAQGLTQDAGETDADFQKRKNDAILAAQDDLNQQLADDQEAALQEQADASRKAADDAAQTAQTNYQNERDAQRAHLNDLEADAEQSYSDLRDMQRQSLDEWLAYQEAQLETGKGDWQSFFQELIAMSGSYGIDAGAAWQAAWINASRGGAGVAGSQAAATAAAQAGPALGAAGFGGFDANGNWVGGTINTIDMSGVPGFATGGVVGGSRPRTMDRRDTILARLRPGETVLTPEQAQAMQGGGGGDVHVHIHGPVFDSKRALEDAVAGLAQPGLARRGPTIRMGR